MLGTTGVGSSLPLRWLTLSPSGARSSNTSDFVATSSTGLADAEDLRRQARPSMTSVAAATATGSGSCVSNANRWGRPTASGSASQMMPFGALRRARRRRRTPRPRRRRRRRRTVGVRSRAIAVSLGRSEARARSWKAERQYGGGCGTAEQAVEFFTRGNAAFDDANARRAWGEHEMSWGMWAMPDAELGILGDVSALDAVELGCGTGFVCARLARLGARVVVLTRPCSARDRTPHAVRVRPRVPARSGVRRGCAVARRVV